MHVDQTPSIAPLMVVIVGGVTAVVEAVIVLGFGVSWLLIRQTGGSTSEQPEPPPLAWDDVSGFLHDAWPYLIVFVAVAVTVVLTVSFKDRLKSPVVWSIAGMLALVGPCQQLLT
jgi:hypothetical protein